MTTVRLWLVKETEKARYYSKLPPERNPEPGDMLWIPRSVCHGTMKFPNDEHHVQVEDWFVEREGL